MPDEWVNRPIEIDYGIDREVEVFVDEIATGELCKIQLKATDGIVDEAGLKRKIPYGTWVYWMNLDIPVLVVLYDVTRDVLVYKWAHEHDPQRKTRGSRKTTTISFDADRILLPEAWRTTLHDELRLRRAIRRGAVPSRHLVHISWEGVKSQQEEDAFRDVQGQLASAFSSSGGLLRRQRGNESETTSIKMILARRYFRVEMPGGHPTITLHPEDAWVKLRLPARVVASDLVMQVAFLLAEVRLFAPAAQLINIAGATSTAIDDPALVERWLGILESAGDRETAGLATAALLRRNTARSRNAAELYWIVASSGRQVRRETYELVLEGYRALDHRPAWCSYNASQVARALHEWNDVVAFLDEAALSDPSYRDRTYWHADRAVALWRLGRFEDAGEEYLRELACGGDAAILLISATEGFILGGNLASAESAHRDAAQIGDLGESLSLFLEVSLILQALVAVLGDTNRVAPIGAALLQDGAKLSTESALNPNALLRFVDRERQGAVSAGLALLAAKIVHGEVAIWALALTVALDAEISTTAIGAIFKSAVQILDSGDLVFATLATIRDNGLSEHLGERLQEIAADLREHERDTFPPPFTVRFAGPDGEQVSFDIDR